MYAPLVVADTGPTGWATDDLEAATINSVDWGSTVPTDVHPSPWTSPKVALRELEVDLSTDEAFPFDNKDGFGPWRIRIEHEARKALREADGKMYGVYLQKLQEISNGYLNGDNQKKLKGHEHQLVPLFEAKVTRDSRIIVCRVRCRLQNLRLQCVQYQIHIIADDDQKCERQGMSV